MEKTVTINSRKYCVFHDYLAEMLQVDRYLARIDRIFAKAFSTDYRAHLK